MQTRSRSLPHVAVLIIAPVNRHNSLSTDMFQWSALKLVLCPSLYITTCCRFFATTWFSYLYVSDFYFLMSSFTPAQASDALSQALLMSCTAFASPSKWYLQSQKSPMIKSGTQIQNAKIKSSMNMMIGIRIKTLTLTLNDEVLLAALLDDIAYPREELIHTLTECFLLARLLVGSLCLCQLVRCLLRSRRISANLRCLDLSSFSKYTIASSRS
mgnify:CR=1 FL=1